MMILAFKQIFFVSRVSNLKLILFFLTNFIFTCCVNLQKTRKDMLSYSASIRDEDSKKDPPFAYDIEDEGPEKYDRDCVYESSRDNESNFSCYDHRQDRIISCLAESNNSIEINKYLDINAFLQDCNFYCDTIIYSKKEIKKLMDKIFIQRKKSLFNLLDSSLYLDYKSDIKNIIIEYVLSKNIKSLFEQNCLYRKFIYKKMLSLEFNKRRQIAKQMKQAYLYDSKISFNKFIRCYCHFRENSYHFRNRGICAFYTSLLRITRREPVQRINFFNKKLLIMEHYRNTKLSKQLYSICFCKIKALTFWKALGSLLLILFISLLLLLGFLTNKNIYLIVPLVCLVMASPILIFVFSLMLDPGFKNIKKCGIGSLEKRNEKILNISDRTYIDLICCRKYEKQYPGLLKPSCCSVCLREIKNLFKCIEQYVKHCRYSCGCRFNMSLSNIFKCFFSIPKYFCICIKKIFNFEVIQEEELLNDFQNNICEEEVI